MRGLGALTNDTAPARPQPVPWSEVRRQCILCRVSINKIEVFSKRTDPQTQMVLPGYVEVSNKHTTSPAVNTNRSSLLLIVFLLLLLWCLIGEVLEGTFQLLGRVFGPSWLLYCRFVVQLSGILCRRWRRHVCEKYRTGGETNKCKRKRQVKCD